MTEEKLMQLLNTLEEPDRRLIAMRYLEGKTLKDAAGALGMTPEETSRRERILLAFLRRRLQKQ